MANEFIVALIIEFTIHNMATLDFFSLLEKRVEEANSLLCVGIDPHAQDLQKLKENNPSIDDFEATRTFCLDLVDQTKDFAAAFKPNSAFFEALGPQGIEILKEVSQPCFLLFLLVNYKKKVCEFFHPIKITEKSFIIFILFTTINVFNFDFIYQGHFFYPARHSSTPRCKKRGYFFYCRGICKVLLFCVWSYGNNSKSIHGI